PVFLVPSSLNALNSRWKHPVRSHKHSKVGLNPFLTPPRSHSRRWLASTSKKFLASATLSAFKCFHLELARGLGRWHAWQTRSPSINMPHLSCCTQVASLVFGGRQQQSRREPLRFFNRTLLPPDMPGTPPASPHR
ncbi:unnamed protein product, partial [Ectocarpus fasciculatus]